MKEQMKKILKRTDSILTKLLFFGHPPKPFNWEEFNEKLHKAMEEEAQQRLAEIQQARIEEREKVLDEIQAGSVSVANLIEKARVEVARETDTLLCILIRDVASKSIEAGALLTEQLTPIMQSLKDRFLKEKK